MSAYIQRLTHHLAAIRLLLGMGVWMATLGHAQATVRASDPLPPLDSAAIAVARAKADTGRMTPGYQNFTGYTTPGLCRMGMLGMTRHIWRRGEADTLPWRTPADTIPTATRLWGKQCVASMTPETVSPLQLWNLTLLAIDIGDTALARQTLVYQIRNAKDDPTRIDLFADFARAVGRAHPVPIAFLESLGEMAQLFTPELQPIVMLIASSGAFLGAESRFDTAAMLRWSAQRENVTKNIPRDNKWSALRGSVFSDSIDIVHFQRVPNLVNEVERLRTRWIQVRDNTGVEREQDEAQLRSDLNWYSAIGTQAPTLSMMSYRFPEDASLAPVQGRVTLVHVINMVGSGRMDAELARLRRMYEQYHDQGLDIVLVVETKGYVWKSPPLNGADEAKMIAWYYQDYLKLPFPVLVEESSFTPTPDGRRMRNSSSFAKTFRTVRPKQYMVARDGSIVAFGLGEAKLDAFLRRELSRPASVPNSSERSTF